MTNWELLVAILRRLEALETQRTTHVCPPCTRQHVKLPDNWGQTPTLPDPPFWPDTLPPKPFYGDRNKIWCSGNHTGNIEC